MAKKPSLTPEQRTVSLANLSQYHPDYGDTVEEHLKKKAERASGKRKYDDKNRRRARFNPASRKRR